MATAQQALLEPAQFMDELRIMAQHQQDAVCYERLRVTPNWTYWLPARELDSLGQRGTGRVHNHNVFFYFCTWEAGHVLCQLPNAYWMWKVLLECISEKNQNKGLLPITLDEVYKAFDCWRLVGRRQPIFDAASDPYTLYGDGLAKALDEGWVLRNDKGKLVTNPMFNDDKHRLRPFCS